MLSSRSKAFKLVKAKPRLVKWQRSLSMSKPLTSKSPLAQLTHHPQPQNKQTPLPPPRKLRSSQSQVPKKLSVKNKSTVPKYHQILKTLYPKDYVQNLKKSKMRVKVRGKKETIYEYLSPEETRVSKAVLDDFVPRRMRRACIEPNPNSLRFPREFRRKSMRKKRKEEKRKKRKLQDMGSVCLS